mmetsp:Transcript_15405/g.17116  ORF Transcript_15405/g.17116 Transcript_15405/m.17116 type:complete len:121 (-) Transcript_15405:36-398(-)
MATNRMNQLKCLEIKYEHNAAMAITVQTIRIRNTFTGIPDESSCKEGFWPEGAQHGLVEEEDGLCSMLSSLVVGDGDGGDDDDDMIMMMVILRFDCVMEKVVFGTLNTITLYVVYFMGSP